MGNGLRFLIGAACIAVIAAVGYFFWGEYTAATERTERARLALREAKAQALRKRAEELGVECARIVTRLVDANVTGPDTIPGDVPKPDVAACVYANSTEYEKHQFARMGLGNFADAYLQ